MISVAADIEGDALSQEPQHGAGVGPGPEGSAQCSPPQLPSLAKNLTNPPGSVRLDGSASVSHLAQVGLEKALFTI